MIVAIVGRAYSREGEEARCSALNGQADPLVTFNKRAFEQPVLRNLRIVSPAEALRELRKSHEKK